MTTWFTADQHFGHANIIKSCARPFSCVDEMDEAMILEWNSVVGSDDEVWHLGDFVYRCGPNRMREIFDRLNGSAHHLVRGNHDGKRTLALPWASIQDYRELQIEGRMLVLFHYPMREWNKSHWGSWSLHGHSHGRLPKLPATCDVGVDACSFKPVSLKDIEGRLGVTETLPST